MRNSRRPHVIGLLLLVACSSDATTVDVDVQTVTVSPAAATLEVGVNLQFTAEALDASGAVVSGQEVSWASSDPSVATVDGNGLATGVQVGNADITATISGVSGSQSLTVDPSPCTTRTDVVLDPGESEAFEGDECLLLPAGSPGDLYRVAIARPTLVENPGNTPTVTLSISPVLATAPEPHAQAMVEPLPAARPQAVLGALQTARALEHLRWQGATRAFHNELRLRERALGLDRSVLLPSASTVAGAPIARVPPPLTDLLYLDLDCFTLNSRQPVTLVAFSDNIVVYQETAERSTDPISVAAANELIDFYDAYVYDMVGDYWGPIPDINADGRVTVVTTTALGENVAGAVYSGDLVQSSPSCPSTNERETVYFPSDLLASLDPTGADPDYFALGVMAHEIKHVVSLYNGLQRGAFNEIWVEEGTAEISQTTASRRAWAATGGPALGQAITGEDVLSVVQANGGEATKEMGGVIDLLAGIAWSLGGQPNSVITDPDGSADQHSFYSTSWLWHQFIADGFFDASEGMEDEFFRQLIDPGMAAGAAAGEVFLTGAADIYELFEDFVVAVSLHGSGFTGPHPIDTWDFITAANIFSNPNPDGDFPWPVTADDTDQWDPFTNNTYTGPMGAAGVRFHDFRSNGSAAAQIHVLGSNQTCDLEPGTRCDRIIVTRLN